MKTFENFLKYDYSMYEETLDDDLTSAIIDNNINFITDYLDNYDVNRLINEQFPIICLVDFNASLKIYKLFIDKGVNIDAQSDDDYKTALMILAESSHHKTDYYYSVIKLLLDNGANINSTTKSEDNALLLSIENIRETNKIQKLLIEYNIDINQQNIYLDTVLNSEVYNSQTQSTHDIHKELILILLNQKNIDLSIKDSNDNDFFGNLILIINNLETKSKSKQIWKNRLNKVLTLVDNIKKDYPKIYDKYIEETIKFKKKQKSKKFNL